MLGICVVHWINVKKIEVLVHLFSVFFHLRTLYEILSTCILHVKKSLLNRTAQETREGATKISLQSRVAHQAM